MYNRTKAILYAQQWAFDRNPKYANFDYMGGDCTNFISQCFYAGGIKFNYYNNGWYYHSLNNRSPAWSGVDELFSFGICNTEINGPKLQLSTIENMQLGDIIQLKVNQIWTHTLIITKIIEPITPESIFICAHTFNAQNKPLSTYIYNDIRFIKVIN